MDFNCKILVRGAGDIATGIIWCLKKAGFPVVCTEIEKPSTIRRTVAFSEAVYEGETKVDGIICKKFDNYESALSNSYSNDVSLIVDENLGSLDVIKPDVVIDSILAKKNIGTNIDMAKTVIGVGPGFTAGVDCNYAIETMRGHKLAYIYEEGSPIENTGVPGSINGITKERVIHAESDGVIHVLCKISDIVKKGDTIAKIVDNDGNEKNVLATIDGVLRGIIRDGFEVKKNLKIADIDPRVNELENCFTISDKARSIGTATLLAIIMGEKRVR